MNTGMQDAWNLSWKLWLIQTGRGKANVLLDSYTQERSGVGEEVLKKAGTMTRVATMRNPVAQFFRNLLIGFVSKTEVFRRNFARYLTELAVHYPVSPLNGETGTWSGGVKPGDRVPDLAIRKPGAMKDERLHSLIHGPKHHLLLLANGGDVTGLLEVGQQAEKAYPGILQSHLIVPGTTATGEAWLDATGEVRQQFGATGPAVALVRPDGYLGYRGVPSWPELAKHLDRYLK